MTLGVALATCCASSLSAQTGDPVKEERIWGLEGLRAGYCVRFLIEPKIATRELEKGLLLLRADQDQTLHPALRQLIETQPEFASWAPSNLCFYYTNAVQVGKHRVADRNPRKAQMLGAWTLGAVEQGSRTRRDLVVDLYASRRQLRNAPDAKLLPLDEAAAGFRAPTDTSGEEYSLKMENALLVWNGKLADDSTRVDQPIVESWRVRGKNGVTWSARLSLVPSWRRAMIGSLQVQGKGDLAKALKASPIRFLGPFYHGGGGELRFYR